VSEGFETRPLKAWLEELLGSFEPEIRARGLALAIELDSEWVVRTEAAFGAAVRELFVLILSTVPDGCEIYFGGTRSTAPVSHAGSGRWSARWQVAGEAGADPAAPTALHPRPGDAASHLESALAMRVRGAFAATRWEFSLEAISGGEECLARASFG